MSKLKRFKENKNKKNTIKLVMAFLLVAIVSATISYAVYQKTDEVLFINAKVGQFEISSSDIELAMKLDGEEVDVPPSKDDGYYNVTVECDHADGEWDEEKWGATITNISSNRVKCNVNFESYKLSIQDVEIGDYISMTPTSTSYTIPTSLTGYSSNQTINPSELNLWRVIRKNSNGTVDAVSEYVSSTNVYFSGQTGYMNFVGALNTIAAQYTNSKYVSKTRHMGYSNQIEKCSSLSACSGDTGYKTDLELVNVAYGGSSSCISNCAGLRAFKVGSTSNSYYFVASRYNQETSYAIRYMYNNGELVYQWITSSSVGVSVRPILTLKSDIEIISGDGKSAATTYQLS